MSNYNIGINRNAHGSQIILIFLVFIAGLLNSQDYIIFMGFDKLNSLLVGLLYPLLMLMMYYFLLNILYKKGSLSFNSFRFWGVMVGIVLFKLFLLFIQNPSTFYPGEKMYPVLIAWTGSFLVMILLSIGIRNLFYLKAATFAIGFGSLFAAIIPILFFPDMIGTRIIEVDGFKFGGAFWNSTLISFISVGWLLVAISTEVSSKVIKRLYTGMFLILMITSLAGLSRSALVSVFFSVLVYLLVLNKLKKYLKWVFLTLVVLIFLYPQYQETIESFQERFDREVEDEPRTIIWLDYVEDLPDYILLGELEGNHKKYSITEQGPHSALLNWLTQYGIIGLLGFCLLLIGILISIKNIRKHSSNEAGAALYAWLISYLSVAMINETGFNEMTVFGTFGIIFAWSNLIRKRKEIA